MNKRQAFFILKKQGKISAQTYNNFRNFVTNAIRVSKKQYFIDKFSQFKNDSKRTWKLINSVISQKSKDSFFVKIDGTEDSEVPNKFNDFFVSAGKSISENLPQSNISPQSYLKGSYSESLFFTGCTADEVADVICGLRDKAGNNLYNIPISLLKIVAQVISVPLSLIFNQAISSGTYPKSLKISKVIPIYKAGERSCAGNYRPISILPDINKIFEKVIYKRLYSYISKNKIISPSQFGFQPNVSTSYALIDQLQYIVSCTDDENSVLSVFLDLKKAFDSVDHKILLDKLKFYGVRGVTLSLLESYLSDRKQFTYVNGKNSDVKPITHGLPQGSNLGPLLFLLFINDFPTSSSFFKFLLFADDSTISCSIPNQLLNSDNFHSMINFELNSVNNWLLAYRISLNVQKTKYILFSSSGKSLLHGEVRMGSAVVERVEVVKFLGILIDEKLTFKNHARNLSMKLSKSVGILHRLKFFMPVDCLKYLYAALILPYLNYGIEVWHSACKNVTEPIFILQKKPLEQFLACRITTKQSYTSNLVVI